MLVFRVYDVIKQMHFPVFFQTTTFELSVTYFPSTWRYKTFSRTFFPCFFKPQRLKYQLLLGFLIHDATEHFPVLFFLYYFKQQRLKYQIILGFLVHEFFFQFFFFDFFFFSHRDNVISGKNTLRNGGNPNFRLDMGTPVRTPLGSRHFR